jgi:hypothetical protein
MLTLNDGEVLSCRLVIDSMGNFSPIVRQVYLFFLPCTLNKFYSFQIEVTRSYSCFNIFRYAVEENLMECALLLVLAAEDLTQINQVTLFTAILLQSTLENHPRSTFGRYCSSRAYAVP